MPKIGFLVKFYIKYTLFTILRRIICRKCRFSGILVHFGYKYGLKRSEINAKTHFYALNRIPRRILHKIHFRRVFRID